ncbi:MAG: heat-inducible transcriptional repressor HrcA [Ignavibacteria bacterium]|nr:heat-inducible transcriptional repressor HrcA [Ignavibacteria bacterium]
MQSDELSIREKNVLRYIIQQFILTAAPVGSRNITQKYDLNFSPATVRNIMSDLEETGFINHPHTSAGRVPTDKGYRFYVDSLMQLEEIPVRDINSISRQIEPFQNDTGELLNLASKLLSTITSQLACIVYPNLDSGILEKMQLVPLSSTRLLIVISIKSGMVKTITLELNAEVLDEQIVQVQNFLNERLSGLSLAEIRDSFHERVRDYTDSIEPVITIFMDSVDKIFRDNSGNSKAIVSGAGMLLRKPEFENPDKLQTVIEMVEDKDIIVHVFEKNSSSNNVHIAIGTENVLPQFEDFSLVTKEYKIGNNIGTLGVIGPKRMDYSKIIAIVDYIATTLTDVLKG